MGRRKNDGVLIELLDLLALLPWWLTLILGGIVLSFTLICALLEIIDALVAFLSLIVALAFFAVALVSALRGSRQNMLFASATDIETIRAMSWREFETLVGEAYRRQGYMVEETGGGGADGGIDLILRGRGQKILVQCKQWRSFKVGVKVVREMYGIMIAARADRVIVVTSGVYTQESCVFARGKPIELIDGKALVQLIRAVKSEAVAVRYQASGRFAQPPVANVLNVQMAASGSAVPFCPKCGTPMVMRTAKRGPNAGGQFWGCSRYPACEGVVSA